MHAIAIILTLFSTLAYGQCVTSGGLADICSGSHVAILAGPSSCATCTTGLVAYYKLDEVSGNRLDSTTNHTDLTPTAGISQVSGIVGNAVSVPSISENLISSANTSFDITGSFTVAYWVKFTTSVEGDPFVIYTGGSTANFQAWNYFDGTSLHFRMEDASNVLQDLTVSPGFSTGTWYFIVAWYDAGAQQMKSRVNNGTVSTTSETTGILHSAGGGIMEVGFDGVNNRFYADEMGIWNRVLTSAEQTSLWKSGVGTTYPTFSILSFPVWKLLVAGIP